MSHEGVPNFPDLFFDQPDKDYLDYIARDVTRIRGTNVNYFRLVDTTERIDGDRPISDKPGLGPFDTKRHSGNVALYGETVRVGTRLDSQRRETTPDWNYDEPFHTRGIVLDLTTDEEPDERGSIYIRTARLDLARAIMEDFDTICRRGDVVELPQLLNGYFDVVDVSRDDTRFGATGFFTTYKLSLTKSSKFQPQRKNLPPSTDDV